MLRIDDVTDNVFLPMLTVLDALPPQASSLQWHMLDLGDVVATERSELDVHDLEDKVLSSPTGLPLTFDQLLAFAANTRQVIDGLFVATRPGTPAPHRSLADADILERSEAVVAAWDSTFWLIAAPATWLERIKPAFRDVHPTQPMPLRAWGPSPADS